MNGTPGSEDPHASLQIRPPSATELPYLSALCLRSKAVWGYDKAFLEACRAELTIAEDELLDSEIGVAMAGPHIAGIVQVRSHAQQAVLEKIFVEPRSIGRGLGRTLFHWALERARITGAEQMIVDADPSAIPFYRTMGMVDAGQVPSGSIPGRMLPRLILSIDDR